MADTKLKVYNYRDNNSNLLWVSIMGYFQQF